MNFKGRPLSDLPGRIAVVAENRWGRVMLAASRQFPSVFGLPFLGPYAQMYRHDEKFTTELSVFNYLSVFLPDIDHEMSYKVVAYASNGEKIGDGKISIAHGAMAQIRLQELISAPLDVCGLFHVQASAISTNPKVTAAIGETAGQFMTLFCSRGGENQASQIIHSHKTFQRFPIFISQNVRHPAIAEHVRGVQSLQFYFLNTNPLRLNARLKVLDAASGKMVAAYDVEVPGHGVKELFIAQEILTSWSEWVCFEYAFDRQVSHRKPILFRHFDGGVATCNHT